MRAATTRISSPAARTLAMLLRIDEYTGHHHGHEAIAAQRVVHTPLLGAPPSAGLLASGG